MIIRFLTCGFCFFGFFASHAQADLILDFFGTPGSPTVSWMASGDIVIVTPTPTESPSGSVLEAPVSGAWSSLFDNNIGDAISNDFNSTQLNLNLLGTGISYRHNNGEFALITTIDLKPSDTAGGDDIEPDPISNVVYPTLAINDSLSWTGTGAFTLNSGTFDTFFIPGTYSNPLDDGSSSFTINISAVPEPSALVLMGLCLAPWVLWRRRLSSRCR